MPEADTDNCGINVEQEVAEDIYSVRKFVGKRIPIAAPSQLAIAGRYELTPEFLEFSRNKVQAKMMMCN